MSLIENFLSSLKTGPSTAGGVVGIDIGSSSIKVVELQDRKGVLTLTTYGELQLGPYVEKSIGESARLEADKEQQAMVDIIREAAVQAKQAVFSMPLASSFVTNVTMDADPEADLSSMVRVEARKVIPASLSEVTLDWAEIALDKNKKNSEEDGTRREVLIAAIQNTALERFRTLMQFVGMMQPPTEIECFSVIRGLYNAEEKNVAVIDIGANSAKLYLIQKGLLVRMYRVRAGGEIATKKIAETLAVSFEAAEEAKYAADRSDPRYGVMANAHNSTYDRAFREFNQVIREHENKSGLKLDGVYLSGGGSLFPGLANYLTDALDRETVTANPFSKVAYPAFMEDTLRLIGPSFTVSLGAALRSFE